MNIAKIDSFFLGGLESGF